MALPRIIYEDKQFLVLEKPAGLIIHHARVARPRAVVEGRAGGATESVREDTLTDWLVAHFPEIAVVGDDPATRPGIVHRLDKETSGIILVARTQDAFTYFKSLFQKREIEKKYLAIVSGAFKAREGIIDTPIGIKNGTIKRSVRSPKMAKSAVTEYRVLATREREDARGRPAPFSLLEVSPKTGRTHQIRVHLASIGHPVAGDRLYGPKVQPKWADRLMLHAFSLEFTSPDGERMKFEATPPF